MKHNIKKNIKKTKKQIKFSNIIIKILIIVFLIFGATLIIEDTFSNKISLLAITEDSAGNTHDGSIINLTLQIKPGTGQIYTNLNTLEEIDTQISIINSQKIACTLFQLDCHKYDFYYTFEGSALVLKGPSASSAIGILVAKTIKHETIDNQTVITGALNSGGIITNVGGIEQKIQVAKQNGFTKVLIPIYSQYNQTENISGIQIIEVIDIIDAYNNFNGKTYELKTQPINKTNYQNLMQQLGNDMCQRSQELKTQINTSSIEENSSLQKNLNQTQESYNSSLQALTSENYYSQGSFCYNSNINSRIIIETQKNLSIEQRDEQLKQLQDELNIKYVTLNSQTYKQNIQTMNDFYVYLILIDRIEEARDYVDEALKLDLNKTKEIDLTNSSTNLTLTLNQKQNISQIKEQKELLNSYAIERYHTVKLWEKMIENQGEQITFTDETIDEACTKINREITIKSELLQNYNFNLFNTQINKQLQLSKNPFENKYLCIYTGLELSGKINTVLNGISLNENNTQNYTQQILNITQSRITLNSNADFPLIPYIYYEYATDLEKQQDYSSSMLYSNYALSYTDLNLYIETQQQPKYTLTQMLHDLFKLDALSLIFIGALLTILGFI